MPQGTPKAEYYKQARSQKPRSEVFADIDSWTFEVFEGQTDAYEKIDFTVVLPPLSNRGVQLKGLCFTRAADLLLDRYPSMAQRFVTIASSMCSAYPWSKSADALFATYKNDERDAWFRNTYPARSEKPLVPLADADYVHEHLFTPMPVRQKNIDVLIVARLEACKNLPLLCEAVLVYARKYRPIRTTIVAGRPSGNWKDLTQEEQVELDGIKRVMGDKFDDYLDLTAHIVHRALPHYYSSARVCVLGSLIEGANRSLKEAMSCNTPVICFKDFNSHSRGSDIVFPEGAGLQAPFDTEALADVIHTVLENPDSFTPRQHYLQTRGRERMFNKCLDSIAYFRDALPGYEAGRHGENSWLHEAMKKQYDLKPLDWVYAQSPLVHAVGLSQVESRLAEFLR